MPFFAPRRKEESGLNSQESDERVEKKNMLTHIVMWKYRSDTSQATRDDHVAQLRSLSSVVPGIQSFSVGVDVLHSPRSYDTGLVATFRDRSVLEAYSVHPVHVKVVEFSRGICETMAKVDFED